MNKEIILKKQKEYIKLSKNLKLTRQPCHLASAMSTACFVVLWCMSRSFFQQASSSYPYLCYTLLVIIAIAVSVYFEKIVSGVIDAFSTIFVDGHGAKAVTGMAIVLIPIMFLAASTSFVGFKNTMSQTATNQSIEHLSNLATGLDASSMKAIEFRQTQEIQLRKDRRKQRTAIEKKYAAKIVKANNECKVKFNEYRTNQWHASKLKECKELNIAKFNDQMSSKLIEFDKKTNKMIESLSSDNSRNIEKTSNANAKVLDVVTGQTQESVAQVNWLGGFLGFAVVIGLIVSLLADLMCKKIANVLLTKK